MKKSGNYDFLNSWCPDFVMSLFYSFISRFLDFLSFIISRFPYLREFFAKHEFCLFRFVFNVAIHGRLLQGEVVFLRRTFVPLSGRFPIKQTSLCTWISSGMMYCKSCSQVILIKLNTCQCKKESSFFIELSLPPNKVVCESSNHIDCSSGSRQKH